jgi:hypothetical protein
MANYLRWLRREDRGTAYDISQDMGDIVCPRRCIGTVNHRTGWPGSASLRPAGFDGPPPGSPFDQTGRKTPLPALINITIPAGTLLGWSRAPADVGSWGLMDPDTARDLVEAASRHPAPAGATP